MTSKRRVIARWQTARIRKALGERRVVLLAGPRQCGKTTLARALQSDEVDYRTLDDPRMVEAAEVDPISFVRHDKSTLIIDEIQRVPDLLPAIKLMVDEDTRPGQFLLTGSANINAIPSARESLAGRVSKIRLRPFSEGELTGKAPNFLNAAFEGDLSEPGEQTTREQLIELGFRGSYPEAVALENAQRRGWYKDYIETLLDRDLRDVARISRSGAMRKLVDVLAAWSSKYMDIAGITSKLSIKRPTVESYINALEALFIAERVPAWTKTDYQRVGTKEKLFLTDCGLMAAVLDWQIDQMRFDADRSGKLVETLAFSELAAQVDCADHFKLYHYRDWEQREVDFVIERTTDGAVLGIEVKASETVRKGDFKHLAWFRDTLAGDRPFTGLVLYAGNRLLSFGDRLHAVPFSALWS